VRLVVLEPLGLFLTVTPLAAEDPVISAPTIHIRIVLSFGSSDFSAFPAVVTRKVTL